MKKNNKKCIVCGKSYTFCPVCHGGAEPAWKNIYHDENCKKIYNICEEVINGNITEAEAKHMFDECDLSAKKDFHHVLKEIIDKAYAAEIPVAPEVEAEIVEETVAETEETPVVETESDEKIPKRMEKKYKK